MPNFSIPNLDEILQSAGKLITQMGTKVSEFAKTLEEKRKATEATTCAKDPTCTKTEATMQPSEQEHPAKSEQQPDVLVEPVAKKMPDPADHVHKNDTHSSHQ